jgi:hypothetical protein
MPILPALKDFQAGAAPEDLGRAIYDALMYEIEPELLSQNLKGVDEVREGETDERYQARQERYKKAFAEYDKQYAKYMDSIHAEIRKLKKESRIAAEKDAKSEDSKQQDNLLSQISQS